jgi:hypothetical protein
MREQLDKLLGELKEIKSVCRSIEAQIRSIDIPKREPKGYKKSVFSPRPDHVKAINQCIEEFTFLKRPLLVSELRFYTNISAISKTMQFMGYKSKVTTINNKSCRVYVKI